MLIKLIAIGQKMPSWINEGYQEYAKRLPKEMRLDLIEIPAGKRGKNADIERIIHKEGELSLAALKPQDWAIALDVTGKRFTTETYALRLQHHQREGHNLAIFIGGPEGLAPACLERCNERWSLSDFTLPHPLVRIILAEQTYRAWTLSNGHPYHK